VAVSRRRLETRFIVKNAGGIYGLTYRGDDAQTNATQVSEEGRDEAFEIPEPDGVRLQTWHYPSREDRVRSCLAVNCGQCHQPGSTGVGLFDARASPPTELAGLIDGALNDTQGDPENRVVAPGSASRSMLLTRIASLEPDHMPPFSSSVPDREGIALLSAWITNDLAVHRTYAQWQVERFGSATDPRAQADADPDDDGAVNRQEFVAGTDPLDRADVWGVSFERLPDVIRPRFPRAVNRACEIQAASMLTEPGDWQPLDVPENRPVFPATPGETTVVLPVTGGVSEFFRVQFRAP
jgi:hypothetical protein